MPDLAPRLPCPVCLGATMEKAAVGPGGALRIDHCGRCGGVWLDHGEVQRLRALPSAALWARVEPRAFASRTPCHDCHAPLDRASDACPGCGRANQVDCPACGRRMTVETHAGLRLDVCRGCKGVWFDHHELEAIWGAAFDRALRERNASRDGVSARAVDGGGVLLESLFYAPDLVFYGAHAAAHGVSASAEAIAQMPGALAAAPEGALAAVEVAGKAAGTVFEVVVEVIGGIFSGF